MKSLTIVGRRWFQRSYGNTYHTATVYVDGVCIGKTSRQYGYGDQFVQSGFELLESKGYLDACPREKYVHGGAEPPWVWAPRHGITYAYEVIDVTRERDL